MVEFKYDEEPIVVSRDAGYPIAELLTPENRRKARERVKSLNYVNSKFKLKELFGEIGIVVNPEAMTYVHIRDYQKNKF